jgi:hypothetical protein
MHPAP